MLVRVRAALASSRPCQQRHTIAAPGRRPLQAPVFIGFFSALRGFAAHKVSGTAVVGAGAVSGRMREKGGRDAMQALRIGSMPLSALMPALPLPLPTQLPSLAEGGTLWFTDLTVRPQQAQ